jgi:hypothetical protein
MKRRAWLVRFDLNFPMTRVSNPVSMIARSVLPALLALAALLTACGKPKIETYRVPKEVAASTPAENKAGSFAAGMGASGAGGGSMANTAVRTASGPGLTWTAPAHWKQKPDAPMRKASYAIAGEGGEAELTVTAFPGDVGGDLANLNRWRGQVELPPIGQAEFESQTQHLDRNELHMTFAEIAGKGPGAKRTLGVMIPYEGSTWFVKLMGPDAIVAKEKPAFMSFLDTVKPAPAAR